MMKRSYVAPGKTFARLRLPALLLLAATLLAACETTGTGPTTEAAKLGEPPKVEAPMTRTRAAEQCWMKTEKSSASIGIDKRADIVTKCIDDKMKAAASAPKT